MYGLGYPSLPVLSVDEFYEQRVREGWFPPGGGQSNSALQVRVRERERESRSLPDIESLEERMIFVIFMPVLFRYSLQRV